MIDVDYTDVLGFLFARKLRRVGADSRTYQNRKGKYISQAITQATYCTYIRITLH
jgi:hypothetical protein